MMLRRPRKPEDHVLIVVKMDPATAWRRMGRSPEELLLACMAVLASIPLLPGSPPPGSLEAILPAWIVYFWAAELLLGGLMIAGGIFMRGQRVETAGLVLMGFTAPAYALAVVGFAGWQALISASIIVGYGIACLARARFYYENASRSQVDAE